MLGLQLPLIVQYKESQSHQPQSSGTTCLCEELQTLT